MKHKIKSDQRIDIHNSIVVIELFADNDTEKSAINNLGTYTASDSERELVENYLHFNSELSGQVLEAKQTGNLFTLKVFR